MSIWSWLKLAVFLWLLRKAFRLAGWLLLAAAAVAAWPVTLVAAAGYGAAWLRGWPPARLYRTAAWALPVTVAWLAALEMAEPGFLAARYPGQAWGAGWDQLTTAGLARTFALLAAIVIPAGLALAGLIWAWRIYAISSGLGGIMASASMTFDARQWKRQIRTATGLTKAPGAVPLLARGGQIPVGGTIRAIGHRWHPVLGLPATSCARHMVVVGATGSGKTFTAVSFIYRLIKFGGARRVLFLVDRSNLGRQTLKEFQQYVTPDDGRNAGAQRKAANPAGRARKESAIIRRGVHRPDPNALFTIDSLTDRPLAK